MAEPRCPYFGECGGCSLQHLDYPVQLEGKRKKLLSLIGFPDMKVFSGKDYLYRNRMDFIFHPGGIGLRRKGQWNRIVDIRRCEISDERLNALIGEIREDFAGCDYFDINRQSGTFHYAVIRTPQDDSSISFVLNDKSARIAEAVEKIRQFSQKTSAKNVIVTYAPPNCETSVSSEYFAVKGGDMLSEGYLGKAFSYSVQGFFQNNHEMAERMISYVEGIFAAASPERAHLLDLYGGVGSFGICCAGHFSGVTIVESVKESIAAAEANIKANGLSNVKAVLLDAMQLKKLDLPADLYVITDPPRSGMHPKTILRLRELRPKMIVYISCNVEQLAKDMHKFSEYELSGLAMFDLFPQTPHIEAAATLMLKK